MPFSLVSTHAIDYENRKCLFELLYIYLDNVIQEAAHMEGKHIDAILSDYDGTLCPTTSVRNGIK